MAHPQQPKNALARLQRQAGNPETTTILWERALGPTSQRLNIMAAEAAAYIRATVRVLEPGHFVGPVLQRGVWFDVYGIYRDGLGWFVKIGEDENGCLVLSHHEPERGPLRTTGRGIIHPTDPESGQAVPPGPSTTS